MFPRRAFFVLALAFAAAIITALWVFGILTQGADLATADSSASYRVAIWRHVIDVIHQ